MSRFGQRTRLTGTATAGTINYWFGGGFAALPIGDFESIQTVTVGSGGQANIEFTSIPATYKHLQIRGIGRGTYNGAVNEDQYMYIQFNSDTASNYSRHRLSGSGSAASSGAEINQNQGMAGWITTLNATANTFYGAVIDILDYENTNKFKTVKSLSGGDMNGAGYVNLYSSLWRSTSAITSIKLSPQSNNFAQYTSFALYGIKVA
jgi:hypothetical protein